MRWKHSVKRNMKRAWPYLYVLAQAGLLTSGCAYFRPSQTEDARFQEQEEVAKDQYLKGSIFDGLVHSVFH